MTPYILHKFSECNSQGLVAWRSGLWRSEWIGGVWNARERVGFPDPDELRDFRSMRLGVFFDNRPCLLTDLLCVLPTF